MTWLLTPVLQRPVTLPAGGISAQIWMSRTGGGGNNRTITVTFANTATGTMDSVTQTFGLPNDSRTAR